MLIIPTVKLKRYSIEHSFSCALLYLKLYTLIKFNHNFLYFQYICINFPGHLLWLYSWNHVVCVQTPQLNLKLQIIKSFEIWHINLFIRPNPKKEITLHEVRVSCKCPPNFESLHNFGIVLDIFSIYFLTSINQQKKNHQQWCTLTSYYQFSLVW